MGLLKQRFLVNWGLKSQHKWDLNFWLEFALGLAPTKGIHWQADRQVKNDLALPIIISISLFGVCSYQALKLQLNKIAKKTWLSWLEAAEINIHDINIPPKWANIRNVKEIVHPIPSGARIFFPSSHLMHNFFDINIAPYN